MCIFKIEFIYHANFKLVVDFFNEVSDVIVRDYVLVLVRRTREVDVYIYKNKNGQDDKIGRKDHDDFPAQRGRELPHNDAVVLLIIMILLINKVFSHFCIFILFFLSPTFLLSLLPWTLFFVCVNLFGSFCVCVFMSFLNQK